MRSHSGHYLGRAAFLAGGLMTTSCYPRHPTAAAEPESHETCEQRREGLVRYVGALPSSPVVSPTRVELTTSTLGRVPGAGPVLELSSEKAFIDGVLIDDRELGARVNRFAAWSGSAFVSGEASPREASRGGAATPSVLYVAAGPDVDVQTVRAFLVTVPEFVDLRLLVRTPKAKSTPELERATEKARDLSSRILFEANLAERKRLADEGYAAFSECAALTTAATSIRDLEPKTRWPALRAALESTLPACDCGSLDAPSLRLLVSAELRAGAASLGWVPLSFLRDERCGATMPLRSVKKLVGQLEQFDEEFSAGVDRDALRFGDVLENDRLRVYFCDPLPGEMLASEARTHATLYLRNSGSGACEGWSFEPLALGTPMGTFRRRTPAAPLAFHYWHATEEIRLFGPIDASSPSKPTDSRAWACDETVHLTGVDASSIETDAGRWFYGAAACARTRDEPRGNGCFQVRAAERGAASP